MSTSEKTRPFHPEMITEEVIEDFIQQGSEGWYSLLTFVEADNGGELAKRIRDRFITLFEPDPKAYYEGKTTLDYLNGHDNPDYDKTEFCVRKALYSKRDADLRKQLATSAPDSSTRKVHSEAEAELRLKSDIYEKLSKVGYSALSSFRDNLSGSIKASKELLEIDLNNGVLPMGIQGDKDSIVIYESMLELGRFT